MKLDKKLNILIIDDDVSILRTLSRVLSKAGHVVDTASTGKDAQLKLKSKTYDAAVIDVGLGDFNGTDLLPQMRQIAPKMLRVILTGTPLSENVLETAKREANFFLLKPVKPETLLKILDEN